MKKIYLKRSDVNYKDFVKRSAKDTDYQQVIDEEVIGIDKDTGKTIFLLKKLDFDSKNIIWALNTIKYEVNDRTNGLKTVSRIFGYNPRNTIRKDFCSTTSLAIQSPKQHALICDYGRKLSNIYKKYLPKTYKHHEELVKEKVLQEWAIKETPFTSGIINKNNPLNYHFDSGNFEKVYSNMALFKEGIQGGVLSMPEYNVGLDLPSNSVLMFDGQSILHGVTPIVKMGDSAYRYTIVYYSLKQMWNCLPLSEEVARIRNVKSKRERNRASGVLHETFNSSTK